MSAHTYTVHRSVTGIPVVICRDASGQEVSRWSQSDIGILTRVRSHGGMKWVRPVFPVPEMVTKLLAESE